MGKLVVSLVLLLLTTGTFVERAASARILGVFLTPGPSHYFLGIRLMKGLVARGHEVTFLCPYPLGEPLANFTEVVAEGLLEIEQEMAHGMNLYDLGSMNVVLEQLATHMMGSGVSQAAVKMDNVKNLLESNQKFDLILIEVFHNELLWALAHKYNCPLVLVSTMGSNSWNNHVVGNPAPYSYVPDLLLTYNSEMNFYERVVNTVVGTIIQVFRAVYYIPKINSLIQETFPGAPTVQEIVDKHLAMVLLNSYPAINDPVPHMPSMKEIGGYHVEDPKPLPKDLKEFMDNAKEGVVLFSMGSNLQSKDLPPQKRDAILKAFSKLKQKVIWKWEDETLPGQPPNVKLMKWLPQNDLMAHPNLRLFLTHGGLLSTIETVFHGVPIVGIPIFGDQRMNVRTSVRQGYGLAVPFDELTEEKLSYALNEVLTNPEYTKNVRKRSQVLRDQPLRPMDSAMFWIEHVLRHKGARHFRSAVMDLEWYQVYLIDVLAFLAVVGVGIPLALVFIVKKTCGGKKTSKRKDDAKKKN